MTKPNCNCDFCGNPTYKRPWQQRTFKNLYCSNKCQGDHMAIIRKRENNPNWKGDNIVLRNGRLRARRWFGTHKPCEICGKKGEIHHIDGNPLNNDIKNIQHLCRKHHMQIDGRTEARMKDMRKSNPRLKHLVD